MSMAAISLLLIEGCDVLKLPTLLCSTLNKLAPGAFIIPQDVEVRPILVVKLFCSLTMPKLKSVASILAVNAHLPDSGIAIVDNTILSVLDAFRLPSDKTTPEPALPGSKVA